jgi:hypothetical protein
MPVTQKALRNQLFVLPAIGLGLMACSGPATVSAPATTPPPTDEPASISSPTPTSTSGPAATLRPTRTPTSVPTAIPTPLPTLAPDEMQATVRQMLQTNGGCELPCWWGITPGETSWEEMQAAFANQGIGMQDGQLDLESWNAALGYNLKVEFEQEDGLVHSVSIEEYEWYYNTPLRDDFADTWRRYALPQVLSHHGVPSEVILKLDRWDYRYTMWVVYESQGIAIYYPGIYVSDVEGWSICPVFGQVKAISIRLQSPAADMPLVSVEPGDGERVFAGTLVELTGMDVQAFYEAFSQPNPQTCALIVDPSPPYDDVLQPPPSSKRSREEGEEDAFLVAMLATNGGCELPCWWTITPGATTWQEAQQMFLSHGKSIVFHSNSLATAGDGRRASLFGRHDPYPFDYVVQHHLYVQDGTVHLVGALGHTLRGLSPQHFAQDWQRYTLDQILARFGKPSHVLLHYWSDIARSHYSVGVMYEQIGVLVEYMGPIQLEIDDDGRYSSHPDPVVICLARDQITDINLWLKSPDVEMDLADVFTHTAGGFMAWVSAADARPLP